MGDTRIRPFCGFIRVSPKSAVLDNAVILELANAFSKVRYKPLVISLIEAIQHSPQWHYLTIDKTLMAQGLSLFKQRLDKDWSLVDGLGI